jgi:hypothetical protein
MKLNERSAIGWLLGVKEFVGQYGYLEVYAF